MKRLLQAVLVLGVIACHDSPLDPTPVLPPPDTGTPPPADTTTGWPPAAHITLSTSASAFDFAGLERGYWIEAVDAWGRPTSPDGVQIISSDPSVAAIQTVSLQDWNGEPVVAVRVRELAPGSTTLSATLGSLATSAVLEVDPFPTAPVAMAVDSFRVLEYAHYPQCGQGCPDYYLYAPVMTLREPAGASGDVVRLVIIDVPTLEPLECSVSYGLAGGQAVGFNEQIDPYPWSNDYILASLTGPVPDSVAIVRIVAQNEQGELGTIEASGPILRGASPTFGTPSGSCLG